MIRRIPVSDGTHLAVQDLGDGDPVVLLAGWGLDGRVWHRQIARLTASRRIITIDLRGHGGSDAPPHGYSIPRLAEDVADVLDALQITTASVVGWSMGGQTAFQLAGVRPDLVSRLVLVSTNAVRASRGAGYPFGAEAESFLPGLLAGERGTRWLSARRQMIAGGVSGRVDPLLVDWLVALQQDFPTWAGAACFAEMFTADALDLIPTISAPTLLLAGTADPMFSRRAAAWLVEQLPDARFVELEGCGHFPMFEDAEAFDAALEQFVCA